MVKTSRKKLKVYYHSTKYLKLTQANVAVLKPAMILFTNETPKKSGPERRNDFPKKKKKIRISINV